MIYSEAVNYIHSLLKFGVRPGLNGMDALLCCLGNPQKDMRYIHVAGTNGKGSTSTAISNVLIDAGYNVGLYTSPYVSHFLERIQFNGKPVDEAVFSGAVESVKKSVEKLSLNGIVITEFEALTAAAFICFKKLNCDAVILEVGLGGRLDATNIIDKALVNIITSLSLDHTGSLGDTIEQIAFEKCGTIKENSRVVVSIGQSEKALDVIKETIKKTNSRLVVPDEKILDVIKSDLFGTRFIYNEQEYEITMPGKHQIKNMLCVIEACKMLGEWFDICTENVVSGIKKTILPARVEILSKKPLVILDGGHNEDGAIAFYNAVKECLNKGKKVYALGGMMSDKAVEDSLKPLISSVDCFVSVTPDNPRAMKATALNNIAKKYCKDTVAVDSPIKAVDFVFDKLCENDVFLCVGSLYLAGEVRDYLIENLRKFN